VLGVEVQIHTFLTLALAGGEWSASCSGGLTSGKRTPPYPLDRWLGGPQSWPGCSGKETKSQTMPGMETQSPIHRLVVS